ncbi:hypothetical protein THIBAULT_117 [Mycobacterium phage Thibault]|uniref:Uncharacterized protein n=1 Tax=Mycobacterium phage Thibault TaxID=1052673 RepID=G1FGI2_9CAUD|nr:hypothetical protein CL87_gp117 [Mycobacterium phage Thibault]AEJ94040.1 hypothetical protein THIBAULT_117 [Mycobacterium phage Thibault]
MKYGDAIEIWASRASGIDRAAITGVEVEAEGEWLGRIVHSVNVFYCDGNVKRRWTKEVDFGTLLNELLEISEE